MSSDDGARKPGLRELELNALQRSLATKEKQLEAPSAGADPGDTAEERDRSGVGTSSSSGAKERTALREQGGLSSGSRRKHPPEHGSGTGGAEASAKGDQPSSESGDDRADRSHRSSFGDFASHRDAGSSVGPSSAGPESSDKWSTRGKPDGDDDLDELFTRMPGERAAPADPWGHRRAARASSSSGPRLQVGKNVPLLSSVAGALDEIKSLDAAGSLRGMDTSTGTTAHIDDIRERKSRGLDVKRGTATAGRAPAGGDPGIQQLSSGSGSGSTGGRLGERKSFESLRDIKADLAPVLTNTQSETLNVIIDHQFDLQQRYAQQGSVCEKLKMNCAELLARLETQEENTRRVRTARQDADAQRDNLQDQLVGLEAEHHSLFERHEIEVETALNEQAAAKDQEARVEKAMREEKAQKASMKAMKGVHEASLQRQALLAAGGKNQAELEGLLDAARFELAQQDELAEALQQKIDDVADGTADTHKEEQLKELIMDSQKQNKTMRQELQRLRLGISRIGEEPSSSPTRTLNLLECGVPRAGFGALNIAMAANASQHPGPFRTGRPKKGAASGGALHLKPIAEQLDDDISSQSSRSVCSSLDDYSLADSSADQVTQEDVPEEGVEDHATTTGLVDGQDADPSPVVEEDLRVETIQMLRNELAAAKIRDHQNKDYLLGRDAQLENKISRHVAELNHQEAEVESCLSELHALKQSVPAAKPQIGPTVDELQRARATNQVPELQEQLCYALEAKRLMSKRLDDTTREIEATQRRYDRIVSDLEQRLNMKEKSANVDAQAARKLVANEADPELDLVEKLRASEQDVNVLRNTLEWKELQWSQKEESYLKTIELLEKKFDGEKSFHEDLERRLKEARLQQQDTQEQVMEAKRQKDLATARAAEAFAAAQAATAAFTSPQVATTSAAVRTEAPTPASWLAVFRCPSRAAPAATPSVSGAALSSSSPPSVSCSGVCWRMFTTMTGIIALACSSVSFRIKDATKKGFQTWGSAALRGASLPRLVSKNEKMEEWFKNQLLSMCSRSLDAHVWDFGCMEFIDRHRRKFDATLICAYLPDEDAEEPGTLMVIIETLEQAG